MSELNKKRFDQVKNSNVDVENVIESRCLELARDYINTLDDPREIKNNNGLFVDMLKYIYRHYLIDVLRNNNNTANRYDFELLDKIFYIYTSLVYRYKHNKRATIIEFCIFTSINRDTLYNAALGLTRKLTPEDTNTVKKWFSECENTLTNNSSVFDMFLLKSHPVYRYNDNLSPVPIESQGQLLSLEQLPDLGNDTAIIDNNPEKIPEKISQKAE